MATIVISGASRGIGLELVRQYSEAGDTVYALCRSLADAGDLTTLAEQRDNVIAGEMDVSTDASVDSAAAAIDAAHIDVLINVAGIVGAKEGIDDREWDHWHRSFEIMTIGPLRVLQAFLPKMGEGSKVITLSSQLAASTWPYGGLYAYGATKAGLNRMMRSVAIDLKDRGIVVGLVHPGYVQTDMGGPEADITPESSASGIRETTAAWSLDETGDFKKWNGEPHAW